MKVLLTQYSKLTDSRFLTSDQLSDQLTDLLQDIEVVLPAGKKICLATEVCIDGIGDLIHQIRTFEIFNEMFPGKIVCYTFCDEKHLPTVMSTAEEYRFQTLYNPIDKNDDQFALIVNVSYQFKWGTPAEKSFSLKEIGQRSFGSGNEKYMGLSPHGVGIWSDNIPTPEDTSALLFSSPELKKMFGCERLPEKDELKDWLEHAWIAQSFQYSEDMFKVTLLAQLEYIKIQKLPIEHFVMKFFGKQRPTRQGTVSWNIEGMMNDEQFVKAFSVLNVKNIIVNDKSYPINDKNTVEVRLSDKRLSHENYSLFQQLLNGAIFPAGDNSYSEAWSNPNTRLPPFLELRESKRPLIFGLQTVVKSMGLKELERDWLTSIIDSNIDAVLMHNNAIRDLIDKSHILAHAWSSIDSPQDVWLAVYEKLKEQDLAKRLPAIIKEQVLFALHPELLAAKKLLLESYSPAKEAVEEYLEMIEKTLENDNQPKLNLK